jgi:myo-inositol 2-dehydrogenase/D-chiro-inositol 1-dehydrogenase
MKVLILGDGADERAWASWFDSRPEYRLEAIYPASLGATLPGVRTAGDLDEALATAGVELVLVGGPLEARGEALRRAAAEGLAIICLHPPGADSEPYYQVALSRQETGAIVVPYLPLRSHPGVAKLRQAIRTAELGSVRGVRYWSSVGPAGADLARHAFACAVDVMRALVGEIEAVTASGDPPGEDPDLELIVQIRAAGGLRGEVRLESGSAGAALITVIGTSGALALEYDPAFDGPARLTRHTTGSSSEEVLELPDWDPHEAIMQTLVETLEQRGKASVAAPGLSLQDGTRAMELSEAVVRSLRRGRTIELHYEAITEEASFKSIMTSTGCTILLGVLLLLPVALAGPALGMSWTIYLAWLIPPVLVAFAIAQILRLGIRREAEQEDPSGREQPPERGLG